MPADHPIVGIDHIQITIPTGTEDEARAFYCDVLGLREIPKPSALAGRGGFWLVCCVVPVHVGTDKEWDRRQTRAHVAYRVTSLDGWRERLTAAGCQIEESEPIPGFDRFETRDPFGNRIEIIRTAKP